MDDYGERTLIASLRPPQHLVRRLRKRHAATIAPSVSCVNYLATDARTVSDSLAGLRDQPDGTVISDAQTGTVISFSRKRDTAALAVGLVNTWDVMAREPELLGDATALRRLLRFYGQDRLARRACPEDVPEVRSLRDRLRGVFEAHSEEDAVELLNAILRQAGSVAQLVRSGNRWAYRHHAPDASLVGTLAAMTSIALLDVVRTQGWARFGLCAAAPCGCVFIDSSHNRSRRYCSDLCADRVSQAAYRQRARTRR